MNPPFNNIRKNIKRFMAEVIDRIMLPMEQHKCPHCFKNLRRKEYQTDQNGTVSITSYRKLVCHHCKKELPNDFFDSKEYTILVIGKQHVGKSTFMTILLTLILGQRGHKYINGVHAKIINREAEMRFLAHQSELYDYKTILEGNASSEEFAPYILRLFRSSKQRITTHFYHFHDIPGEEFGDLDNLLQRRKNLNHADAILFLIDPLQIENIPLEIEKDFQTEEKFKPADLLLNVLEVWSKNETYNPNRKIEVPIGVCLSKADIVKPISTFYIQDELDRTYFSWEENLQEIPYISEDCRTFLEFYDEKLIDLIETRFKTVQYFPISPLGFTPTEGYKDIDPQGVLSPFMWLLSHFKF